jgi:hypothetical protein
VEISDKNLEVVINGCVLDKERLHFHMKTFILLLLHDKTGHVGSHKIGLAGVQVAN